MVKKKVLPAPDKYASCPGDELILEYYKDTFDSVFVAYHQFYKPNKIPMKKFESDDFPSNNSIREDCTEVTWREVLSQLSFNKPAEMDVGLRTYIGGLNRRFENKSLSNEIQQFGDSSKIKIPDEGCICPFVEGRVLTSLMKLGYEWLWVGDEFGTERKLLWIEDILTKDELPYSACSYTPDKKLLIATHWDSHCTFICSNRELLTSVVEQSGIEGFYCDEKTEVYWGINNEV